MSSTNAARTRGLGRVFAYYVVLGVALGVSVQNVPFMADVVSGARLSELEGSFSGALTGTAPVGTPVAAGGPGGPWAGAIIAALSMAGALLIMVPVTWVYMVTRRHRGYEESVVHTLLILPVAVTGIVMIVQNSIALAFSLAGIVAAVRFRTTLDDTKDAVYVFLAIGVGLATGVQALGIALTLSVVFNAVVVVLWLTHFGNIYADQNTRAGPLGFGDVLAGPGTAQTALRVGDPAVLEAAAVTDLHEIAERAVRIERHIGEERLKKKERRANTLVIVIGPSAEAIQAEVDPLFEERAVRWKLAEIGPADAGTELIYLARLDGLADQGAIMDRVRAAPSVAAAELRSLKGIKPRS
ncbi:MAG: DUF4956 domain-containing protein [Gemmatimonadota bacterium]